MEDVINPFDLLGLDHKTCTLADVRAKYRTLAFSCHPDKGGSMQDMRVLQNAYDWIMRQMTEVKTFTDEAYEAKQADFKQFLESQENTKVYSFSKVVADSLGYSDEVYTEVYDSIKRDAYEPMKQMAQQFVKLQLAEMAAMNHYVEGGVPMGDVRVYIRDILEKFFQRATSKDSMCYASVQHGYGDLMEKDNNLEDVSAPVAHHFGKQEMIIYTEPSGCMSSCTATDISLPQEMDDYSESFGTDYRVAYQDQEQPLRELEAKYPTAPDAKKDDDALETMIHERRCDVQFSNDVFKHFQERLKNMSLRV